MKHLSRRKFLQQAGISAGTVAAVATLPSFLNSPPKNRKAYDGKKINIALCGLGRYAGYLAEGLESSQYCRLAGIITGTPSKATDWKKKYNIPEKNIYN